MPINSLPTHQMPNSSNNLFIGTMSGTSHDGIDVCAISGTKKIKLHYFSSYKYPRNLHKRIAAVIQNQELGISEWHEIHADVGVAFASAINKFFSEHGEIRESTEVIGLSGQTLWHHPQGKYPFSLQAGDPKVVAELCGIDVVSDFRNSHIHLGGEGAPLVPEFHQKIFLSSKHSQLILNIGGIANFSFLGKDQIFLGSDCGPGNSLMDVYCQKILNCAFDKNGKWAAAGLISKKNLDAMLKHAFFKKCHPKSTGREVFNLQFIPEQLLQMSKCDVLATLAELTAISISRSIQSEIQGVNEIIVCGGGINNKHLMGRIEHHAALPLISSSTYGFHPQAIESMAFGWMAQQRFRGNKLIVQTGNNQIKKGLLGVVTRA